MFIQDGSDRVSQVWLSNLALHKLSGTRYNAKKVCRFARDEIPVPCYAKS